MHKKQLIEKLRSYYCTSRPDLINPAVTLNWVNHEGWESEIYGFTLTTGQPGSHQSVKRVLRLMSGGSSDDARHEYQALSLLFKAGYPVPKVFAVGSATDGLGHPFIIMQCIEGESYAKQFPRQKEENPQALTTFIELFRQLHTLDWQPFVDNPEKLAPSDRLYYHFDRTIAKHASYLTKPPFSDFQPVIQWLKQHRDQVPCQQSAAVHQDFHPDNILQSHDGHFYVIDWTNFEISDYRFDLAWTLMLAFAYGGEDRRSMIFNAYEKKLGQAVPSISIFEVDAILRRIGSIMLSLAMGADSMGMRPDIIQTMKNQKEPVARLHQRLQDLTKLSVPAVESLLMNLN
jgi:aminoglycoside phosphotransferase (APT) family kinase protein